MKRQVLGNPKKHAEWGFHRGAIGKRDRVYVLATMTELEEKGEHVTQVLRWTGSWAHWIIEWGIAGICALETPKEIVVFSVGLQGRVNVASAGGFSTEEIDTGPDGPYQRGMLRDVRLVGGRPYAVGMARQVYKRAGKNRWTRLDQGILAPKGQSKGLGLNAIDGFGEDDLYAAGWGGEIWHRDARRWTQIASPTNLILERVVCAPDGEVYVCGQSGIILRGRGSAWRVVEQDATEDDFWGMTWFEGELWLATLDALYVLRKDRLQPVKMGDGPALTCGWLDAKDGVLWSVGSEDIAYFDGKQWLEVRY